MSTIQDVVNIDLVIQDSVPIVDLSFVDATTNVEILNISEFMQPDILVNLGNDYFVEFGEFFTGPKGDTGAQGLKGDTGDSAATIEEFTNPVLTYTDGKLTRVSYDNGYYKVLSYSNDLLVQVDTYGILHTRKTLIYSNSKLERVTSTII